MIIIANQYCDLGFDTIYRRLDAYRLVVLWHGCGDRKYKSQTLKLNHKSEYLG